MRIDVPGLRQYLFSLLTSLWFLRDQLEDDRAQSELHHLMKRIARLILLLDEDDQSSGKVSETGASTWLTEVTRMRPGSCKPASKDREVSAFCLRLTPATQAGSKPDESSTRSTQRAPEPAIRRQRKSATPNDDVLVLIEESRSEYRPPWTLPSASMGPESRSVTSTRRHHVKDNATFLSNVVYSGLDPAWATVTAQQATALLPGNSTGQAGVKRSRCATFADGLSSLQPGWADGMSWALNTFFGISPFWSDLIGDLLSRVFLAPLHLPQIALAARVVDVVVPPPRTAARGSRRALYETAMRELALLAIDDITADFAGKGHHGRGRLVPGPSM
ncbi:hypothetical protein [Amycolatopsis sp. NPDC098790]|uniref:hypothetical protein n=1 Tax=Amycolatopsis sp. NPDC098790 TaxID=3363939 RepID=UPI0038058FE9